MRRLIEASPRPIDDIMIFKFKESSNPFGFPKEREERQKLLNESSFLNV